MTILPRLKQDVLDAAAAHLPTSRPEPGPLSRAQRALGRRGMILTVAAAGVAAAAVTLGLIVGAAVNPRPAYALTRNPDGTVTVTMHELAAALQQVNAKFRRLGVDYTVIPITRSCKSPAAPIDEPARGLAQTLTLTAGHKYLLPGWHGVLAAEQLPDGKVGLIFGAVLGHVPRCISSVVQRPTPGVTPLLHHHRPPTSAAARLANLRETKLLSQATLIAFGQTHK